MLQPARTKYRKQQKGRRKGLAQRGSDISFGDYGLQTLEAAWLSARQIEAGLDQYADIDEGAQLRATQESTELVDEELMRRFDEDRGISHREVLGSLGDRGRIGDEVDDDGLGVEANIELCKGCGGAQSADVHADRLECVSRIGDERSESLLVMEEQIEIAGLAVLGVEAGECGATRQGPRRLQPGQRDQNLLLEP